MDYISLISLLLIPSSLLALCVIEVLKLHRWANRSDIHDLYQANLMREFSQVAQQQLQIVNGLNLVSQNQAQAMDKLSLVLYSHLAITQKQAELIDGFSEIAQNQALTIHQLKIISQELIRDRQAPKGDPFVKVITED